MYNMTTDGIESMPATNLERARIWNPAVRFCGKAVYVITLPSVVILNAPGWFGLWRYVLCSFMIRKLNLHNMGLVVNSLGSYSNLHCRSVGSDVHEWRSARWREEMIFHQEFTVHFKVSFINKKNHPVIKTEITLAFSDSSSALQVKKKTFCSLWKLKSSQKPIKTLVCLLCSTKSYWNCVDKNCVDFQGLWIRPVCVSHTRTKFVNMTRESFKPVMLQVDFSTLFHQTTNHFFPMVNVPPNV